jgi:predicted lipase
MSTRNAPVLREIIDVLFTNVGEQASALNRLEHHFSHRLLADVGDISTVGQYAEQLRLRITEDERSVVLDYIAEQKMVVVTIDVVENAINSLLGWDRFVEP